MVTATYGCVQNCNQLLLHMIARTIHRGNAVEIVVANIQNKREKEPLTSIVTSQI